MLRPVLREMLRLVLRPVLRIVDQFVASRVANHVASLGANLVAHGRCARVNRPIYRQTSSLNTARGWERRCKCCAKLAQKSLEHPAGKSGLCKRLIFRLFPALSGNFRLSVF